MMNCKKITTDRLELIPFSERFISEKYVSWLNDPNIVKYSENRHSTHSIDSCRGYLKSFEGTPNCLWAICTKDTMLHIGNINSYVDLNNNIADIGIMIGEKGEQGKGYAFEAWKSVCDYLLNQNHIRKITAGTMAENKPMIRIMEKAGMVNDGIRKRHFLFEKEEIDLVQMALFNSNHRAQRD